MSFFCLNIPKNGVSLIWTNLSQSVRHPTHFFAIKFILNSGWKLSSGSNYHIQFFFLHQKKNSFQTFWKLFSQKLNSYCQWQKPMNTKKGKKSFITFWVFFGCVEKSFSKLIYFYFLITSFSVRPPQCDNFGKVIEKIKIKIPIPFGFSMLKQKKMINLGAAVWKGDEAEPDVQLRV